MTKLIHKQVKNSKPKPYSVYGFTVKAFYKIVKQTAYFVF